MTITGGPQKSSCNAGELSPDLDGKIGLKPYYNGGRRFKNIEPVPQSGFRLMPGTALVDTARSASVRHVTLPVDASTSYTLIFSVGWVDIYRQDRVKKASLALPEITADLLPELEFYAEAATVGIFHESLQSIRLVRNGTDDGLWAKDLWPYDKIPEVDLGGVYAKTNDVWKVFMRWINGSSHNPAIQFTVDGETASSVEFGLMIGVATEADWNAYAANIQASIEALPSLGVGVTVTQALSSGFREFTITFGGALTGQEYDLAANVVNTSEVSALAYHTSFGETAGEPLISAERGWFAGMQVAQDRGIYFAPKARRAALSMSRTGEYFDLNIEAAGDAAARLEALRTQTSLRILTVYEDKYLLAFADTSVWFASNRTIKKGEPLNWVRTSSKGIVPHVPPAEIEDKVYYVSGPATNENALNLGQTIEAVSYDDVSTRYTGSAESLLGSHLIREINGSALQAKVRKQDAARWWLKQSGGRLICALVIRSQDIMAMVEWVAADNGKVRGVSVDGQNQVWLTVERGGVLTVEVMEEQEINLFQGAVRGATDLAGRFSGLDRWEGREVWARADGYILGPFTVSSGSIDLGDAYASVCAGLWQAPVFESMPLYKVNQYDEIIPRPGRIHSVLTNVMDTESIAIGANGGTPKNQSLLTVNDPVDAPLPAKTAMLRTTGIPGFITAPTVVITQTRPGMLRVRDYVPEARL